MKTTIEFDESLYRRLKIEAARRGRTVRDLVDEGVRHVLGLPLPGSPQLDSDEAVWFASLREYADNAGGEHDLAAMRRTIAGKRLPRTPVKSGRIPLWRGASGEAMIGSCQRTWSCSPSTSRTIRAHGCASLART